MSIFNSENIVPDKNIAGAIPNAANVSRGEFEPIASPRKIPPADPLKYNIRTKNASGMIGQFIQHAANTGFQRTNRFVVLINGPSIRTDFENTGDRNFLNLKTPLTIEHKIRLALTCQEASVQGKGLMTEEYNNTANGPNTIHAHSENYSNDLSLTFLCSSDFFEKMYFQMWMNKIINSGTHEVAMYENYAQPWSILVACLPSDFDSSSNSGVTFEDVTSTAITNPQSDIYYVQYDHVYPYRISDVGMAHSAVNDIIKLTVQFRYHRWYDPLVKYMQEKEYVRQSNERLPTYEDAESRDAKQKSARGSSIGAKPESIVPVERLDGPNYNPLDMPLDAGGGQIGIQEEKLSPFEKFKKIARDIARYSNPQELKGLIINQGLGQLNDIIGEGNVESIAQAGQVVDVFLKTDKKDITSISNKLIGPLGQLL